MRKVKPKLKPYDIISDKVREWIPYGIHRYYKHRDEKSVEDEEYLIECIYDSIMLGLVEVIDFD